jgi:hypothetical protein
MTNQERDVLIQNWLDAKAASAAAVELERALRQQVMSAFYPEQQPEKGTFNQELGNGYKLKFGFKQNLNLNATLVNETLSEIERTGEDGKFVAERLVKFKPELSLTEYANLSEAHRRIIDRIVTTKPAAPTIEFVEPKAKA